MNDKFDNIIIYIKEKKSLKLAFSLISLRWTLTWITIFIAYKLSRIPFVDPYIPIIKGRLLFL